jgi:hypothetical protein
LLNPFQHRCDRRNGTTCPARRAWLKQTGKDFLGSQATACDRQVDRICIDGSIRGASRWRLAMSSAAELQKAIFEALGANAALTDLIDARVFDHAPASVAFPYITFGRTSVYDWSTGTENGTEQLFTLHVWSKGKGKEEALEIMELARETLHDAALDLDGHHRLIILRLEFSEARYDDRNEAHHGLLRFRAVVEEVGQ